MGNAYTEKSQQGSQHNGVILSPRAKREEHFLNLSMCRYPEMQWGKTAF